LQRRGFDYCPRPRRATKDRWFRIKERKGDNVLTERRILDRQRSSYAIHRLRFGKGERGVCKERLSIDEGFLLKRLLLGKKRNEARGFVRRRLRGGGERDYL